MNRILIRTLAATSLAAAVAASAAAQDAHHPPSGSEPPRTTAPAMPGPSGAMMGNMMQMMHQMMSGMMQDRGAMHRMGMMGMGDMGMTAARDGGMAGIAIENIEGHIAFLKAELKIAAAQGKVWDDYAAALRANAKQLNELATELAKAPVGASPAERLALQEKTLTVRLEIVRRTKPALAALDAALSADQKKTLAALAVPRMGMR